MSWKLSRFRAGDLVEVRSKADILATLDAGGCVDGMPFMPEMLQYCGRQLRVASVAHKTCDVAMQTRKARRLDAAVHLEGASCDGSAHGGCQAACNLFWKDVWLRPAGEPPSTHLTGVVGPPSRGIGESQLRSFTQLRREPDPVYSCQATRLFDATRPLAWWNPRQYLRDVTTGNHSVWQAVSVLLLGVLRVLHAHAPKGTYRVSKSFYAAAHRWVYGRPLPGFGGRIPAGQATPSGRLNLQPGERVRIKSKEEIEQTLDTKGQNRGLYCDAECAPFCGAVATVRKSVVQFIDEGTGRMRRPKEPCIMLEGVACKGLYSDCRLLCPRAIPSWWREVWLERIPGPGAPSEQST